MRNAIWANTKLDVIKYNWLGQKSVLINLLGDPCVFYNVLNHSETYITFIATILFLEPRNTFFQNRVAIRLHSFLPNNGFLCTLHSWIHNLISHSTNPSLLFYMLNLGCFVLRSEWKHSLSLALLATSILPDHFTIMS